MDLEFRAAQPGDAPRAVPLIHASGPRALEYVFSTPSRPGLAFQQWAFEDGRGFLGFRNHTAVLFERQVVAVATFYEGKDHLGLSLGLTAQVLQFYPLPEALAVSRRCLHLRAIMPPTDSTTLYAAHMGIVEDLRGRGIGSAFFRFAARRGLASGLTTMALDLAEDNPRAGALYERLGFARIRRHRFPGPAGRVPDTIRMVAPLSVLAGS